MNASILLEKNFYKNNDPKAIKFTVGIIIYNTLKKKEWLEGEETNNEKR